jgi:hypothetical protein
LEHSFVTSDFGSGTVAIGVAILERSVNGRRVVHEGRVPHKAVEEVILVKRYVAGVHAECKITKPKVILPLVNIAPEDAFTVTKVGDLGIVRHVQIQDLRKEVGAGAGV